MGASDVESPCLVQTRCGGCPSLHLPRASELTQKANQVASAFSDQGIDLGGAPPIHSGSRSNYRNRLRLAVENGRATLFNQQKRHGCPALRPELWRAIEQLRTATSTDANLLPGVDHVEVRVGDEPGLVGLALGSRGPTGEPKTQGPADYDDLSSALGSSWLIAHQEASNQPALRYFLGAACDGAPLSVDVPINAFVQVNSEVNRLLVDHVRQTVLQAKRRNFIDLFSGAGNLSIPLLDAGLSGVAVERSGSAIDTLIQRGVVAPRTLTTFVGDVKSYLTELAPTDVVICNPPRKGLRSGHSTISSLTSMLICVGCDAEWLAYDAAQFISCGFELSGLQCFDMFPGTKHVETVAVLRKPVK